MDEMDLVVIEGQPGELGILRNHSPYHFLRSKSHILDSNEAGYL